MKYQELIIVIAPGGGVETAFLADHSLLEETQEVISDSKKAYYGISGVKADSFKSVLKNKLEKRKIKATFIPYVEMPE